MSLFPAYDTTSNRSPDVIIDDDTKNNVTWLKNSSFQPEIIPGSRVISISSDSSDCELLQIPEEKPPPVIHLDSDIDDIQRNASSRSKKRKKSKKHKSSKENRAKAKYEPVVENVYFEDKIRDRGNFKVDTLCSRARPLYNLSEKTLGFSTLKYKKRGLLKRYFISTLDSSQSSKKKSSKKPKIADETNKTNFSMDPDYIVRLENAKEEEIKSKIKEFNEKLLEEPDNIGLWIEYINYEDRDENFEISPQTTKSQIVKYQRKLAITEKALEKNPDATQLVKLKLKFLNELSPVDQYVSQLEEFISKDAGNMILWQTLINTTRSSLVLCTATDVTALYAKCFGSLHLWSKSSRPLYDAHLLQMLYQCLIFFRHVGFWEQMWEALRMNLTLNLEINKELRDFKGSIEEKKLIDMEEVILTSQLPLNQLWLRVERLREHCHWLTVKKEDLDLIGDSHRFISPEEVTEFVHPLLSVGSNFRLAIYTLLALKVPLFPTRSVILDELGMEESNWGIDSSESLLPMFFPCVGEMAGHKQRNLLARGVIQGGITSGPQYSKFHPAQDGFIDFIRQTFNIIAEKLPLDQRNQIYVWWLRFERVLVQIHKATNTSSDKNMKKLKTILKEFLKKEDNRNNLNFYREYAIIEREMGRWENCLNILETAIENSGSIIVDNTKIDAEKKATLSLYRTLIESLLDTRTWTAENKNRIIKNLAKMSLGKSQNPSMLATERLLKEFYEDFINNSTNLVETTLEDYFQPSFACDVVMCYVYFLYITGGDFKEICGVFEQCLERSRENRYLQELFYEGQIAVTQLIVEQGHRKWNELHQQLEAALYKFPDNFYLLSVSSGIESELPNWTIRMLANNKHLWRTISSCLAGRARLHSLICQNDSIARNAALNKLLHFHKRLSNIPEIRCCPLIWRLYMLLLQEHSLCEKKGEEVYHESIASCPWARCIYIDAAEIAPQLLTQIQDIIKEKDLRMHVTPEELNILRG